MLPSLYRGHLVALHGFIKKSRATPDEDLALARKRQKEGIFEEAQAQAVKEVVAWQLAEAMKKKKISKARMATLLKTRTNAMMAPSLIAEIQNRLLMDVRSASGWGLIQALRKAAAVRIARIDAPIDAPIGASRGVMA